MVQIPEEYSTGEEKVKGRNQKDLDFVTSV